MTDVKGGYAWPTATRTVSSSYQGHKNRNPPSKEPGTDIACAYGSTIVAPEDGRIVEIKRSTSAATGRYATLDLNDGNRLRFLHLKDFIVASGSVKRGQPILISGASAQGKEWGVGAHVHVTLIPSHSNAFLSSIDFQNYVGADNDGVSSDANIAALQSSLNIYFGEKLVIDGIRGGNTIAATKRAQRTLGVTQDGIWGPKSQAAFEKRFIQNPAPVTGHVVTWSDVATIGDIRGLQKIAKLYGYKGTIDNIWGPGTQQGMANFLNQNYGGLLIRWLRAKWGYTDQDDYWGPNMRAALVRANAANVRAL